MTGDLGPRARIVFIAVLVLLGVAQWVLREPTKTEEQHRPASPGAPAAP
jgi:hypothetical protein